MKRITVSDNCVACGYCIVESNLFEELPNGKAIPSGTGMITDSQYTSLVSVIENCPVKSISVVEDDITKEGGITSVLALKKLIGEDLKGYKVSSPNTNDFEFEENEHIPPLTVGHCTSNYEYSTYDKAQKEGLKEFERLMYSQRKTLTQAVLISYKEKQLSRFSHYIEEEGNYYYDVCDEISKILTEIEVRAKDITNGQVSLPGDFTLFEAGPDYGYDGDTYCYKLRNIEKLDYWDKDVKSATYYDSYINCDELGDRYRFDLHEVQQKFREYIPFEVSLKLGSLVYEWMDEAVNPFNELVRKRINEKVVIISSALKACPQFSENSGDPYSAVKNELIELIEEVKQKILKQENVFKSVDTDYSSDYRFTSESKSREAAENRLWRFYNSCQNYLSTGHNPRISNDLSEKYQHQIESIINDFKSNVQAIFDKHELEYPRVSINAIAQKQVVSVDLTTFEDCSSNINWEIRDLIDNKIIGSGGKVKHYEYFEHDTSEIDIIDTSEWRKGLFGREIEYKKYGYILWFNALSGFNKACEACCDYTYEDGFLKEYFNKLIGSLLSEFNKEVIAKISADKMLEKSGI